MAQAYAPRAPILHPAQNLFRRYRFEIYLLRRNPMTLLGVGIILFVVFLGVAAPLIAPFDPLEVHAMIRLQAPEAAHWMGTDDYGRDIFSRVLYATQVDLVIAVSAVTAAALLGVVLGSIAGYFRGLVDDLIMRTLDVVQAFPAFILAMGLAVALGPGEMTIIYVVGFIMIPIFARLVRSEILSARERGYVEAARCMGAADHEIIFQHLLPNCLTPVLVQFALSLSYAILDAAALSFVGLGVRPPDAEWGSMINQGVGFIVSGQWWLSIFPGLMMSVTILGFNLLADGLRDVLDPKLRS